MPCARATFHVRAHGQHWGAGEQLTITANHHHEGAPLTVALMSCMAFRAHVLRASVTGLTNS